MLAVNIKESFTVQENMKFISNGPCACYRKWC
jgi:hypothetical protein